MSLSQAVLDVAKLIRVDSPDLQDEYGGSIERILNGYAMMLESAVKAAGVEEEPTNKNPFEDVTKKVMSKKVQRESEELKEAYNRAESGVIMAELVGGPMNGDMVEISSDVPRNGQARVPFNGEVYILQNDGILLHTPEESAKYKKLRIQTS